MTSSLSQNCRAWLATRKCLWCGLGCMRKWEESGREERWQSERDQQDMMVSVTWVNAPRNMHWEKLTVWFVDLSWGNFKWAHVKTKKHMLRVGGDSCGDIVRARVARWKVIAHIVYLYGEDCFTRFCARRSQNLAKRAALHFTRFVNYDVSCDSRFQPPNTLLKQEGLQLAEASFRDVLNQKTSQGFPFAKLRQQIGVGVSTTGWHDTSGKNLYRHHNKEQASH